MGYCLRWKDGILFPDGKKNFYYGKKGIALDFGRCGGLWTGGPEDGGQRVIWGSGSKKEGGGPW